MTKLISRVLALALGVSVLQAYALPVRQPANDGNSAVPQGATLSGRLTTGGNKPISLNGGNARSGDTVFSGQSIQTPAGVGASVTIPGIGRVDIAPNSKLTFN